VSCSTSLRVVCLKIYLTSTLKLHQQNFHMIFTEVIKTCFNSSSALPFVSSPSNMSDECTCTTLKNFPFGINYVILSLTDHFLYCFQTHLQRYQKLTTQRSSSPYAMETYGEVEVWPHSFLTLTLDGSGWSGSHPGHFTPLERNPGIC